MRRALGKGLAQLLGESSDVQANELSLDAISPNPNQPRHHFDQEALEELAHSIREVGLLQPIIVRPISEGAYEIVAGERRWRASKLAGLSTVPVVIRAANDEGLLQLALIENIQREDINPVECALAYRQLSENFGLKQEEISKRVGKSRVAVANVLRLLKLPEEVLEGLTNGLISEGHARALLGCEHPKSLLNLFYRIVDEGLTVRETERLARATQESKVSSATTKPTLDPDWLAVQGALSERLGTPVTVSQRNGKGKITFQFFSEEELQRILDVLSIEL